VIFSLAPALSGGSALTLSYAQSVKRPVIHIHKGEAVPDAISQKALQLKDFIDFNSIEVLNIAGPRERGEPGVYQFTLQLLQRYWSARKACLVSI